MTNQQIVAGNTVYLATCAHCGKQRMTFARNKAGAAKQLRDAGWTISDNNLCDECRGKPVFNHLTNMVNWRGDVVYKRDDSLKAAMKQRHDDMFL